MENYNKIWSKNKKLNAVLTAIADDLQEIGVDEVKRYVNEFPKESDHNIASYGNMLIYHDQIKEFYRNAGYTSLDKLSDDKRWNIYRRQVGYVARELMKA